MSLSYEDGSTPQYNGNIANQSFANSSSNTFTYQYDKLNRLLSATATGMSEELSYDVMGNITSLNRDGTGAKTYNYSANQLQSVTGVTATNYIYDANGNAITDGRNNKTISYNYLNLPQTVSGGLSYTYDATGQKLTKNNNGTLRHYLQGIEYQGTTIDIIQTEEGIARHNGNNAYSYEYNLTDHLGNVRVSFYKNPSTNNLDILQRDDYYAFGKRKVVQGGTNKYLYNGKELQEELGEQYDYGARFYDPVIGRWNVVDPLAEKMMTWSPYTYAFNNPLRFIDVGGMIPYPITIRAFAPMKTFGGGFGGDNRGYTTNNTTARVTQKLLFDTDKSTLSSQAWSSMSHHPLFGEGRAMPRQNLAFASSTEGDSKWFGIRSDVASANPLTPSGTPDINIFSALSITENKKAGTLSIDGRLTGDNFPSTEAFISDPSGKSVFLGIGFFEGNPLKSLPGQNKDNSITNFSLTLTTDKKGNFTGVQVGDQKYSIDDWNKMFQQADPYEREKKKEQR
jgi:RHS repeat-associated protein